MTEVACSPSLAPAPSRRLRPAAWMAFGALGGVLIGLAAGSTYVQTSWYLPGYQGTPLRLELYASGAVEGLFIALLCHAALLVLYNGTPPSGRRAAALTVLLPLRVLLTAALFGIGAVAYDLARDTWAHTQVQQQDACFLLLAFLRWFQRGLFAGAAYHLVRTWRQTCWDARRARAAGRQK